MTFAPHNVLYCKDLAVTYRNGAAALRGVSFSVASGERVAVVGESGCGKSTLVRSMLGLLPGDTVVTGSAIVGDGRSLIGAPEKELRKVRGRTIGYVPQNPLAAFDPIRSVGSQIAEAWRCHGRHIEQGDLVKRMNEIGIPDAVDLVTRRPSAWSGGMLQRASIVAATALRPRMVLADEPTSAVDRPLAKQMLALLAERSEALIAVTHDIDLVGDLFDRVIVLYAGRIVEDSAARLFLAAPGHPYSRALVGSTPRPGKLPAELMGDPPSLLAPIAGCAFAPRCSQAATGCLTDPLLIDGVACHSGRVS